MASGAAAPFGRRQRPAKRGHLKPLSIQKEKRPRRFPAGDAVRQPLRYLPHSGGIGRQNQPPRRSRAAYSRSRAACITAVGQARLIRWNWAAAAPNMAPGSVNQ